MDWVSGLGLLFAAIAAVASVIAVFAAIYTIGLTRQSQQEDRVRRLAEALIAVMTASEDYPGGGNVGGPVGRYEPFDEAIRQLKQTVALSILGLSADVTEPLIDLLKKNAWRHPNIALFNAHKAFESLNTQREAAALPSFWRPWRRPQLHS